MCIHRGARGGGGEREKMKESRKRKRDRYRKMQSQRSDRAYVPTRSRAIKGGTVGVDRELRTDRKLMDTVGASENWVMNLTWSYRRSTVGARTDKNAEARRNAVDGLRTEGFRSPPVENRATIPRRWEGIKQVGANCLLASSRTRFRAGRDCQPMRSHRPLLRHFVHGLKWSCHSPCLIQLNSFRSNNKCPTKRPDLIQPAIWTIKMIKWWRDVFHTLYKFWWGFGMLWKKHNVLFWEFTTLYCSLEHSGHFWNVQRCTASDYGIQY